MTDQNHISPVTARQLLADADRISARAHDAVRWPYVTFILALGVATSLGTLAMALTEGDAFGLTYFGTLAAVFALLLFFLITTQGRRAFAWSRRWTIYIAAWFVPYAAAIMVVAFAHGSVLWAGIASGAILAVTLTCATIEARR